MVNKSLTEFKTKQVKNEDIYKLEPQFDTRNSFYGKAKVDEIDKNNSKLYSYGTLVAEIQDGVPVVYDTYSQTTLRHIKEYLKQNGFKDDNSKQIMTDYGPQSNKEIVKKGV